MYIMVFYAIFVHINYIRQGAAGWSLELPEHFWEYSYYIYTTKKAT